MMYAAWSTVVDYLCWLGSHFSDSTERRTLIVSAKKAIHAHMKALLHRAMHGTDKIEGLLGMEHITLCGVKKEIGNRLCIFLFRLKGMDSSTAADRYNQEYGIRLAARIKDAYSTIPLEALGWTDAVRLSAAHYNTPDEFDRFLKATKELGS